MGMKPRRPPLRRKWRYSEGYGYYYYEDACYGYGYCYYSAIEQCWCAYVLGNGSTTCLSLEDAQRFVEISVSGLADLSDRVRL